MTTAKRSRAKRQDGTPELVDMAMTAHELAVLIENGAMTPAIDGDYMPRKLQAGEYVAARCNLDIVTKFCCLSCAVMIPNAHHLGEHLQTPGHTIAAWCSLHGAEAWQ